MLKKNRNLSQVICLILTLMLIFSTVSLAAAEGAAEGEETDEPAKSFGPARELLDEPLVLSELNVSIWPEYDKAETLVIYSGILRNDSKEDFTGRLKFFVPSRSDMLMGKAEMVCETEVGMKCIQYEIREMEDGYGELTWTPTTTIRAGKTFPFMLEFYYDPLEGDFEKTLAYEFLSYYNTENLVVSVKPPVDAEAFSMNPTAQWDGTDDDGFTSYFSRTANLPAGETLTLAAQYTREASGPSYTKDDSGEKSKARSVGVSQISDTMKYLLTFFVIVIGGLIVYAMKAAPANHSSKHRKQQKKAGSGKKTKRNKVGSKTSDPVNKKKSEVSYVSEKKKARRMLLEGKISEETYNEIIADIEDDQ